MLALTRTSESSVASLLMIVLILTTLTQHFFVGISAGVMGALDIGVPALRHVGLGVDGGTHGLRVVEDEGVGGICEEQSDGEGKVG